MKAWQKHRLGDVVDEGGGSIQTGPFGSQLHASDYVAEGIPCIMPANMKNNRVDVSRIARISEQDAKRLKRHIVQTGDIVYSRRGDVTQKALIRENENGFFCGTGCLLLRPGKKIDPAFLTYYLSTKAYQSWIASQAVGATMPNLNTGILKRVSFCAPDKDDQERIASVLAALDAKIELNQRMNEELEGMAKLLYNYWFVQFDFPMTAAQAAALGKPQLAGKPYRASGGKMIYNETLKREIPEEWEAFELSDVITRSGTGLNPRDNFKLGTGTNYYVTIKNIKNGKIVFDNKCDRIDDATLLVIDRRSQLQTGDVLFTSIEPVGITYLIREKPTKWNINESVFTLRPDFNKTTSEHLYFLLSSSEMKCFTKNSSAGSIHKGIRHGVLRTFRFAYAGKSLIEDFSTLTAPILKRINILDKETEELTKLRDWLLPMLMNGQVTVN
jgi:type I restriction enzyme S subunit